MKFYKLGAVLLTINSLDSTSLILKPVKGFVIPEYAIPAIHTNPCQDFKHLGICKDEEHEIEPLSHSAIERNNYSPAINGYLENYYKSVSDGDLPLALTNALHLISKKETFPELLEDIQKNKVAYTKHISDSMVSAALERHHDDNGPHRQQVLKGLSNELVYTQMILQAYLEADAYTDRLAKPN